jgi:hypothetical protein
MTNYLIITQNHKDFTNATIWNFFEVALSIQEDFHLKKKTIFVKYRFIEELDANKKAFD